MNDRNEIHVPIKEIEGYQHLFAFIFTLLFVAFSLVGIVSVAYLYWFGMSAIPMAILCIAVAWKWRHLWHEPELPECTIIHDDLHQFVSEKRVGYVYLLRNVYDKTYKIGRTTDPKDRRKTFNVKLPFDVEFDLLIKTNDCVALEIVLHEMFASRRIQGTEWFTLTADDIVHIKRLER